MSGGSRVLVVEDDDSMREAIESLLDASGFEPVAYASAEALLAGPALHGAACIVCDIRLPAMSGLDLLSELRGRGQQLPFIVITAHDSPGVRSDAERRGAAAFLAKPFPGAELLAVIKRLSD